MSNLQIGLAVLGVVVLLGIVAHGAWVARKSTPRQPSWADVASKAQQHQAIEPGLDAGAFDLAAASAPPSSTLDKFAPGAKAKSKSKSESAPQSAARADDALPLPTPEKRPALDALIDVIAPIGLDASVSGVTVLAALPGSWRVGSKPYSIEGQNDATKRWETPQQRARYSALQAGVQLANRSGPLSEIEFSEFVVKTEAFCDTVGGTADFPVMRNEVARARELDKFAGDHDAQLSFVLRARLAAWSPGYVQQHAMRIGFVPGALPGRLVVPAGLPHMPPILSLSFDTQAALADDPAQAAIRELVLSLDVAQVERGERPFARMREAALTLATQMDGVVTDDNAVPLPASSMDVIGIELESLYDQLDQRDLSAGSALARRLFS